MKLKFSKSILKKTIAFSVIFSLISTSFLPYFQTPFSPKSVSAAGNSCSTGSINGNYSSRVGGVALDQAATFLANMDDITGAYYDEGLDRIVFVGKTNTSLPEFDKDDLAVAIRAVIFNKTIPMLSMENDPNDPNGPNNLVYYYGDIEDTRFGQVLFDADFEMKKYEIGYDENQQKVTSAVSGYKSVMDRYIDHPDADPVTYPNGNVRFWLTPQLVTLKRDDTADAFVFDQVKMEINTEPKMQNDPALDEVAEDFAQHHTDNYDLFAQETPSYADAKQLGKIVAVIKWLSDYGIATDFSWAHDYEPEYVATPREVAKIESPVVPAPWGTLQITGGVEYLTPNTYSQDTGTAVDLKSASEAVNAPKEDIHWTFTENNQQYEAVAVAADAFRSLGSYSTSVTDMSFPTSGDNELEFTRTYSSYSGGQNRIGRGWSFMPAMLVDNIPLAAGIAVIPCNDNKNKRYNLAFQSSNGFRETFTFDCNLNAYVPDENIYYSSVTHSSTSSAEILYTVRLKDQTEYLFQDIFQDPTNTTSYTLRLLKVLDKNGNSLTYNYDSVDRLKLLSITDDYGNTITLSYNSNNLISSISDWTNRTVSYTYDTQGNLLTVTDPENSVTTYTYDDNNKLASIKDRENQTILTNTYTPEAKIATQSAVSNLVTTYSYDEINREIVATDNFGRTEITTYDEKARILEQEDALQNSETYTYGTELLPLTVTDKNNNTITNTYDTKGNLTSVTYPDNKTVTYEYNTKNQVTKIIDGRYGTTPKETIFTYDSNGNLTEKNEAGFITSYTYNSDGEMLTHTDPLTQVTTWTRDAFGNKLTEKDALNKTTTFEYDVIGRLKKQIDANNKEQTLTYDDNNNILTKTDAAGTTTYTYDNENRLEQTTLANNAVTQYTYNATGTLDNVTDALNNLTEYNYDAYQNITSKEDALNRTTQYVYDDLNRRKELITPLGKVTKWEYDGNGNITKRIDAKNQETIYTYNNLNRLTQITYPDTSTVTYTYDDRGNVITMVSPVGTTSYTYDIYDRLREVTDPNNAKITYTYDNANNLESITYPNNKTVWYDYDANNRLSKVVDWNGQETKYTYNDNGTLAKREYPNGIITKYTYDGANKVIGIEHLQKQTPIAHFAYTRDVLGNIKESSESGILTNFLPDTSPPDVDDFTIYGDTLANNWNDWSWNSTNNLSDTTDPHSGSNSISWEVDAGYAGLKLFNHLDGIHTAGYSNLTFALKSSQAGQVVQVQTIDDSHQPIGDPVYLDNYGGQANASGYKVYTIPLEHLQSTDRQINGIFFQDLTGTAQPAMYVDSIKLTTDPILTKAPIYEEATSSGWNDWSWNSTNNLASTTYPHSGTNAISWTVNSGYAGLKLYNHLTGIDTTAYTNLSFALRATQANQLVQVQMIDENHNNIGDPVQLPNYGGDPVAGSYKEYEVPLSDLSSANRRVYGVLFQDITGTSQPAMYIDDVKLTTSEVKGTFPVYEDKMAGGWDDWSWNSSNNLADTSNVYSGTKNIAWTVTSGYGALKFFNPRPFDTTGYSHLTFALKATQTGQTVEAQLVDDQHQPIGNPVSLTNYGGDAIPGSYKVYEIPLSALSSVDREIGGITIQDITGTSQPAMYVDAVGFKRIPTATPLTQVQAEYWNSGTGAEPPMPTTTPDVTRTDSRIHFNWGTGSPDPAINNDHFIARWTKTTTLPAGWYKFAATADDGVRVKVDNEVIIDGWIDQPPTTYYAFKELAQGQHTIVMEYYENDALASAELNYTRYNLPEPVKNTFTYDLLQRLTSATYLASQSAEKAFTFTYDDVGNRLTNTLNGTTATSTYNNDNQITAKDTASFTYDNNGNQVSRTIQGSTKTLTFDYEDRLLSFTDPVSSTTAEFIYDAEGNRLKEEINNTPVMQYVSDVSGDLTYTLEAKDLTTNESTYYVYGLGLLSQGDDTYEGRQYLLEDGLGNYRYVVDTTGGETQAYEYDPDGNEFMGGTATDFRYKGEQLDDATGLYFMRARYYDPMTGTFISKDPVEGDIMLPQSQNGYSYAHSDPINLSDPSGEAVPLVIGAACARIAASAISALNLSKSLASQQQVGESGKVIAGKGSNTVFRDAAKVAQQYGGQAADWVKKTSSSFTAADGTKFQTHWVENIKTGAREMYKTVFGG